MLPRVYALRKEIAILLDSKQQDISHFHNAEWLVNLALFVDIATHMNDLNEELVGKNMNAFDKFGCVTAFERKLRIWEVQIQKGNYSHFPNLETEIKPHYFVRQIQDLRQEVFSRFVDFGQYANAFKLFGSPFQTNVEKVEEKYQLKLIDSQCDEFLKARYDFVSTVKFY